MAPTTQPAEMHHTHRDVSGGALRPATFGVMDGLVSNFALVLGVVGGGASSSTVVLTGLAGLVAGASSMATGEYVSVASQSDLARAEIQVEKRELERNPEDELTELTYMFRAKGLDAELAGRVARTLSRDPDIAWRTHVREELGIDPDNLPSPWQAAGASFLAFSVGALLPVLPFLLGASTVLWSVVISLLGLAVAGAIVAKITARPAWFGATRQLTLGVISSAATFGIGLLVGSALP